MARALNPLKGELFDWQTGNSVPPERVERMEHPERLCSLLSGS
jgi:hypothetical protein